MYIGVDIGGSKILVTGGEDPHKLENQKKVDTPGDGAEGVNQIIALIEEVSGSNKIKAIGIGTASLDRINGAIVSSSPNMPGWRGTRIVQPLLDRFKVPVEAIMDVTAAGLAESEIGSGDGQPYVLYVTLSTGINASLIIDGQPYRGAHDLEAGHIVLDPNGPPCGCGGRGHFESMSSGSAVYKKYGKYGYQIDDAETWDEIAATMAMGFHSLITVYSPSIVVVGGGLGVHFPKFEKFLLTHLKGLSPIFPLPPIVHAKFSETATAYGAQILASRLA